MLREKLKIVVHVPEVSYTRQIISSRVTIRRYPVTTPIKQNFTVFSTCVNMQAANYQRNNGLIYALSEYVKYDSTYIERNS